MSSGFKNQTNDLETGGSNSATNTSFSGVISIKEEHELQLLHCSYSKNCIDCGQKRPMNSMQIRLKHNDFLKMKYIRIFLSCGTTS